MFLIKVQITQASKSLLKTSSQMDLVMSKINQQYSQDFYKPFQRLESLQFEAIVTKGIYVLEIIDKIRFNCESMTLQFGVSFVDRLADGSYNFSRAITLADKALANLQQHDDYGNAVVQVNLGRKNSFEKMINESLRMCDFVQSRWRKSQYELVQYLILNYGYMDTFIQKDVAKAMDLSPQNLNQQLKNSGYYNLIRMKRELTVVMEQFRRVV